MRYLIWSLSHPNELTIVNISSGWINSWLYLIRMTSLLAVPHLDDLNTGSFHPNYLWTLQYVIRMTYHSTICRPGDLAEVIRSLVVSVLVTGGHDPFRNTFLSEVWSANAGEKALDFKWELIELHWIDYLFKSHKLMDLSYLDMYEYIPSFYLSIFFCIYS